MVPWRAPYESRALRIPPHGLFHKQKQSNTFCYLLVTYFFSSTPSTIIKVLQSFRRMTSRSLSCVINVLPRVTWPKLAYVVELPSIKKKFPKWEDAFLSTFLFFIQECLFASRQFPDPDLTCGCNIVLCFCACSLAPGFIYNWWPRPEGMSEPLDTANVTRPHRVTGQHTASLLYLHLIPTWHISMLLGQESHTKKQRWNWRRMERQSCSLGLYCHVIEYSCFSLSLTHRQSRVRSRWWGTFRFDLDVFYVKLPFLQNLVGAWSPFCFP